MPVVLAAACGESLPPSVKPDFIAGGAAPAGQADAGAHERVLAAALRHFALHGLGAVDAALGEARRAGEAGDERERQRWLAICAMFDRRAALAAADGVLTETAY